MKVQKMKYENSKDILNQFIIIVVVSMFSRMFKFFNRVKPIIAISGLAFASRYTKVFFDDDPSMKIINQQLAKKSIKQEGLKRINELEVCNSKDILEGQLYFLEIQEQNNNSTQPKKYKVVIGRVKGQLYAVLAHCTYSQPLSDENIQTNQFSDAIIFNQKLYCPHHGCAFNIKNGSVQYGPATNNLPRFFVQQKKGKVYLYHPSLIPVSVIPKYQLRDLNDLRKVVIIGGDHNATMGVINGLKQYEYGGQITVVMNNGQIDFPYREDLLHRKLLNLNKSSKKWLSHSDSAIEKQLQQKIYSKLNFFDPYWYEVFGIQFIFNPSVLRVINKKYFPFVKFADGTKVQFDGIVYATGFKPQFPQINGITKFSSIADNENVVNNLPANIFAPFYNKKEHLKLSKFLNKNKINNLLVLGMNVQSLQFIQEVHREFPGINVKVIDMNKDNSLTQLYGPDIGDQIIQEYIKKGVQFYIKVTGDIDYNNRFSEENVKKHALKKIPLTPQNSISLKLDQNLQLKGDCMVLFPNNTVGQTENISTAKHVDIDFAPHTNRIIVDINSRTDTKRMYAAGSCTNLTFFFTRNQISLINSTVALQQGMNCAFNLNAMNIPYNYIPFESHKFFNKRIFYAGARKQFNQMYIIGDVKKWDFIAFYALNDDIIATSATPSKQKQFQVIRQSFRLQCQPKLSKIVKGEFTIAKIYELIRKLNKSGCYKDLIREIDPEQNIGDVIWMDRQKGSFVNNKSYQTPDLDDQLSSQFDSRGYQTESS